MSRFVIVNHQCGQITTFEAPNREIQLVLCTAYLVRDPIARVTHDLIEGQGWEAGLKNTEATIVIAGGPAALPDESRVSGKMSRRLPFGGSPPADRDHRAPSSPTGFIAIVQRAIRDAQRVRADDREPTDLRDRAIAEIVEIVRAMIVAGGEDNRAMIANAEARAEEMLREVGAL